MRVLVTGADGFVGRHLTRRLRESGDEVFAVDGPALAPHDGLAIDVRDGEAVSRAVSTLRPDCIVHLAASSSVAGSHRDPSTTFAINALGTLHVCAAASALLSRPRLLLISSGEVYGQVPAGSRAPESSALVPTSPYASSKVSAEVVAHQFARSYGLPVICARPFSHIGAGQARTFAMPSFARQLANGRRSGGKCTLSVGDLGPIRDYSHVDDVVAAYRLLLERGTPGDTYNVCSGAGHSMRSLLDELVELSGVAADVRVDPAKLRPVEIPYLVGDPSKLLALGWSPKRALEEALSDVLNEATSEGANEAIGDPQRSDASG